MIKIKNNKRGKKVMSVGIGRKKYDKDIDLTKWYRYIDKTYKTYPIYTSSCKSGVSEYVVPYSIR